MLVEYEASSAEIVIRAENPQNPGNVDLRVIYTPAYFDYLGLELVSAGGSSRMSRGGGASSTEEYTAPFKYFVYAVEENPVFRTLFKPVETLEAPPAEEEGGDAPPAEEEEEGDAPPAEEEEEEEGEAPPAEEEEEEAPLAEEDEEGEEEGEEAPPAEEEEEEDGHETDVHAASEYSQDPLEIAAFIARETQDEAVPKNSCPRIAEALNLPQLARRLYAESAVKLGGDSKFKVVFVLKDDDLGDISRAVQEDQILSTRLKGTLKGKTSTLPSFWDVWHRNRRLREKIAAARDPHEAKWQLGREFGYKMATTFMPLFAKAIYELFGATSVLDPCAGWGDRLIAAAASPAVERYVGFDPNRALRPGYARLMSLMGHDVAQIDEARATFRNGFEVRVAPFEAGAKFLDDESFDLVMTSPPFFDYEAYSPANPAYRDWIEEFYKPLFVEAARCVKPDGHVAIHIGDTSAGAIEPFLQHTVHKICNLRLAYKIGLRGTMSGKDRTVWVFKKVAVRSADAGPPQPREADSEPNDDSPIEPFDEAKGVYDVPMEPAAEQPDDGALVLRVRAAPGDFPHQGQTLAAILRAAAAKPGPQAIDEFAKTRLDYPTADAAVAALHAQLDVLRREHGLTLQEARPERIVSINGVFVCVESAAGFAASDKADPGESADVLRPLVVRLTGYEPEALVGTRVARLASRAKGDA